MLFLIIFIIFTAVCQFGLRVNFCFVDWSGQGYSNLTGLKSDRCFGSCRLSIFYPLISVTLSKCNLAEKCYQLKN